MRTKCIQILAYKIAKKKNVQVYKKNVQAYEELLFRKIKIIFENKIIKQYKLRLPIENQLKSMK